MTEPPGMSLADWTAEQIDAECEAAYEAYFADVRRRHIAYFAERPERRSPRHPFAAKNREAALPDGWNQLAHALPRDAWHRHHLSASSSQLVALVLLTAAARADPSLRWIPGDRELRHPLTLFEVALAPAVLNERPRQTSLDWLVLDCNHVIAGEAKFTEKGFGHCSCEQREVGVCSERVLERPYWAVAAREMPLERKQGRCSLSLAYQAVRNVAAAQVIAGEWRQAEFLLVYDNRNPYFVGAKRWPGWVAMLEGLTLDSQTPFVPLSWQRLLTNVDLDSRVADWAATKHALHSRATR